MNVDAIFVMGVSGCGKTTAGAQLADRLGWNYKDADDFHSEANVAKMSAGIPLNDEDRRPWLLAINDYCRSHPNTVVGCSALKKQYRDILRNGIRCKFVFLDVSRKELERRLIERKTTTCPLAY
ncbi:shikimate kinase [Ancylostoma duodenale]|uniref:Gluconokinase n=1 Tax=Ancylostoma duodenale TaxID=51022 RepID=A0A0C2DGQ0_9BILA|nr:shikimate kinase [Ancylostoma duodenale]